MFDGKIFARNSCRKNYIFGEEFVPIRTALTQLTTSVLAYAGYLLNHSDDEVLGCRNCLKIACLAAFFSLLQSRRGAK